MLKKVSFEFKKKKFEFYAVSCGFFSTGLILRSKDTIPCVFEFKKPVNFRISSLFVLFPFVAVWLDNKNKIVDIKIVKPFNFAIFPKKSFSKILEIPINEKYKEEIKLLVGD